ncbi:hypothetical protein [Paraburkholderia unamae]|uniref:hypothetical protein n=1 Tax=Paraburkholderia unamae TaxID=219649 RepID=UPI0011BD6D71|nr:hypothetical protein [Paraburkholderia unamae]
MTDLSFTINRNGLSSHKFFLREQLKFSPEIHTEHRYCDNPSYLAPDAGAGSEAKRSLAAQLHRITNVLIAFEESPAPLVLNPVIDKCRIVNEAVVG